MGSKLRTFFSDFSERLKMRLRLSEKTINKVKDIMDTTLRNRVHEKRGDSTSQN